MADEYDGEPALFKRATPEKAVQFVMSYVYNEHDVRFVVVNLMPVKEEPYTERAKSFMTKLEEGLRFCDKERNIWIFRNVVVVCFVRGKWEPDDIFHRLVKISINLRLRDDEYNKGNAVCRVFVCAFMGNLKTCKFERVKRMLVVV
jgi:hypothetical protein